MTRQAAGQADSGAATRESTVEWEGRTIVVRQRPVIFIAFAAGGALVLVFPWLIQNVPWWARVFLSGLGLASVVAGIGGWYHHRIGLVIDRHGLWCSEFQFRGYALIPWSDVEDVRLAWWHDLDGDHEGVLLELKLGAPHPCGAKLAEVYREELEATLGSLDFFNPLLLYHEEWQWSPAELVPLVQRWIQVPADRMRLGEFRKRTRQRVRK